MTAICAMLTCLLGGAVLAAPGQLDPTFGTTGKLLTSMSADGDVIQSVLVQPDGKIIAGGLCFTRVKTDFCVARYEKNGSLDLTFGTSGKSFLTITVGYDYVRQIALQADGKIVAVGGCGEANFCLARFDTNGAVDTTFGLNGIVITDFAGRSDNAYSLAIQTDGRVVAAGQCRISGVDIFCLARYLTDGTLDNSFGSGGKVTTSIAFGGVARGVAIQSNGNIVAAGDCTKVLSFGFCAARYLPNGDLDASFGVGGIVFTDSVQGYVVGLNSQTDGKLILIGYCSSFCLARYLSNGALDVSFGGVGYVTPSIVQGDNLASGSVLQADGKIVVAGNCALLGAANSFCVARYRVDGTLDTTLNGTGYRVLPRWSSGDSASSVGLQSDGKILVGGRCLDSGGQPHFCLARLKGGPYNPLTCGLNVDANQTDNPMIDALLISRYLLGFRGTALTNGAVGPNPTRTGQALEDYLGALNLDVDGDGAALATTDGLLLLRAMLGLTGTALTQGATNVAHPNVRNAQQILTWIEDTHGVACLP